MAHMRKCSMVETVHLCKHYERNSSIKGYGNSDVDMTRSSENYNLAPKREGQTEYIRQMLDEINHANRKDLVVMGDLIITAPADLPMEFREAFFKETYDFCVDRYGRKSGLGEDVVISSYVHLDESTPHMHFAFLPISADIDKVTGEMTGQRFCGKEVINRQDLRTLHKDMQAWLDRKGIPARVLNGNTRFDSNGKSLSVKELKRGDSGREKTRWDRPVENREKERGRW